METREIHYDQWEPFFNDFTHLYQGRHVNVETFSAAEGEAEAHVRSRLCDLPLVGILCAHPAVNEAESIEIIASDQRDPRAAPGHVIVNPQKVQLAEEENGQAVALQIESADDVVTILRFQPSRENMPAGFKIW